MMITMVLMVVAGVMTMVLMVVAGVMTMVLMVVGGVMIMVLMVVAGVIVIMIVMVIVLRRMRKRRPVEVRLFFVFVCYNCNSSPVVSHSVPPLFFFSFLFGCIVISFRFF